jgi:hypothetical protein
LTYIKKSPNRVSFASGKLPIAYPDFLDVQVQSFKDFFQFVQEHNLLVAATPRPALKEPVQDWRCSVSILLDVLDNAIGKLLVIESNTFRLVKRNESPHQKLKVFLFERNGKPVDDRS